MRKSAIFVAAFLLDRFSYAVQLGVMTYLFGVSDQTDIYFLVVLVPTMILNISSDVCFVAIMQGMSKAADEVERWLTAGRLLLFFLAIYCVIGAGLAVLSGLIIDVIGFGLTAEAKQQAVALLRLTALMVLGQGIGIVVGTILLQRGYLLLGTMRMPVVTVLGLVSSVAMYFYDKGIWTFVAGMCLGGILLAVIMCVTLFYAKGRYGLFDRRSLDLRGTASVAGSAFYNILTNLSHNLLVILERSLASHFGSGVVTLISLARTVLPIIGGVPGAITNARFVEAMSLPHERRMANIVPLSAAMTWQASLLGVPLLLVFLVNIDPIVGFLYQRGKFGAYDRQAVAHLVVLYGLGFFHFLLGGTVQKIYQMAHFDRKLTAVTYAGMVVYALLILAVWHFNGGADGLVIAYSVAFNAIAFVLYFLLVTKFGVGIISATWIQLSIAAAVSCIAMLAARAAMPGSLSNLAVLATSASLGLAAFATVAWLQNLSGSRIWIRNKARWVYAREK